MQVREATTAVLVNCVFEENSAAAGGVGGLHGVFDTQIDVVNCAFLRNDGGSGGGAAWFHTSSALMANCTVSRNSTSYEGGGVVLTGSSLVSINCALLRENPYHHRQVFD